MELRIGYGDDLEVFEPESQQTLPLLASLGECEGGSPTAVKPWSKRRRG